MPIPRLIAEGKTAEEAIQHLQQMIRGGKAITIVDFEAANPFLEMAGDLKEEPLFDAWVEAMQEYRKQKDADPNY